MEHLVINKFVEGSRGVGDHCREFPQISTTISSLLSLLLLRSRLTPWGARVLSLIMRWSLFPSPSLVVPQQPLEEKRLGPVHFRPCRLFLQIRHQQILSHVPIINRIYHFRVTFHKCVWIICLTAFWGKKDTWSIYNNVRFSLFLLVSLFFVNSIVDFYQMNTHLDDCLS